MSRYGQRTRLTNAATADVVANWFGNQFVLTNLVLDALVVAGGGGGDGGPAGGGGGAGGVIAYTNQIFNYGDTFNITIGAGGLGASNSTPTQGVNSSFSSLTAAYKGDAGAGSYTTSGPVGSQGGGAASGGGGTNSANTATAGQGNAGGNYSFTGSGSSRRYAGGGGGGYGTAGANASAGAGGNGGDGNNSVTNWGSLAEATTTLSFGVSGYIAGGGGGGYGYEPSGGTGSFGNGGSGGGGRGGNNSFTNAVAGTVNTGSGGGGNGFDSGGYSQGGNGGSGIVVLRYPITSPVLTSIAAGLTYSTATSATYRYYKFTAGTGTITV
jgi:hypothetical protein